MNDDMMVPEQRTKLFALTELRESLVLLVDNTIDMMRDDISSISDAHTSYDVAADIVRVKTYLDDDVDVLYVIQWAIENGYPTKT